MPSSFIAVPPVSIDPMPVAVGDVSFSRPSSEHAATASATPITDARAVEPIVASVLDGDAARKHSFESM